MSKRSRCIAAAALVALLSGLALGGAGCAVGFRAYDPEYSDYHYWSRDEESVFRIYLDGRHEPYRKFRSMDSGQQREYWKWRHEYERPDSDRH
jgi:hypothetical protein